MNRGTFTIFLLLLSAFFSQVRAQETSPRFIPIGALSVNFNANDLFTGLVVGISDSELQWEGRISFDFRPFFSKVQIAENGNEINQYYERKYLLSADLEKRFFELKLLKRSIRPFAGVRSGILFGNYRGLRKAPEVSAIISPNGGLAVINKNSSWKFGYMYLNSHNIQIPEHRIFIQFSFNLKQKE